MQIPHRNPEGFSKVLQEAWDRCRCVNFQSVSAFTRWVQQLLIVAKNLLRKKSLQQIVCLPDRTRNGRLLIHKVTRKADFHRSWFHHSAPMALSTPTCIWDFNFIYITLAIFLQVKIPKKIIGKKKTGENHIPIQVKLILWLLGQKLYLFCSWFSATSPTISMPTAHF